MDESIGNQQTLREKSIGLSGRSLGDAATIKPQNAALGRIDQYELLRELGGGGFGVVYLARDTVAGIEVAVKGLPPLVRNNAEELERIRENFALVSKLHHPNIAAALVLHPAREVSYTDEKTRLALRVMPGDTLMVMAYAPGVTLNKWRKQFSEGKVPVDQALEVCRQIAAALDYAHGEKVVHRDVKPSNVMVETRGNVRSNREEVRGWGTSNAERPTPNAEVAVRVLDFGLAAEIRSSMSRVSQEKGDTSGTRPYMAPEQWAGKRQDGRTDQYALAALFYELVSGAVPFASAFDTGDPVIMQSAVLNLKPEPLSELTKAQNVALLRGLAKDPSQRFASCGELVAALGGRASPRAANDRKTLLWLAGTAAIVVASTLSIRSIQSRNAAGAQMQVSRGDAVAQRGEDAKREAERLAAEKAAAEDRARKAEAALAAEQVRQREAERLAAEKRDAEEKARAAASAARAAAKGPVESEAWDVPDLGMALMPIAPGSFQMGSDDGGSDEKPVRTVRLTRPFWMGKTEVTQKEYQRLTGSNPSHFKGDDLPVETVSWDDAVKFCEELTRRERSAGRLPSGYVYRLPTEAEWEYAARGGAKSRGYTYAGGNDLDAVAWFSSNSGSATHAVGTKAANELGLFDMSGNVWEWCQDWYQSSYSGLGTDDPSGPSSGSYRVDRGGSWSLVASYCRVASRTYFTPSHPYYNLGFRVCLAPPVQ